MTAAASAFFASALVNAASSILTLTTHPPS